MTVGYNFKVLGALNTLENETGSSAMRDLAKALMDHLQSAADRLPDIILDGSLALWKACRPLLDGCFGSRDKDVPLVLELLSALHRVFHIMDLDDLVLRCAAVKFFPKLNDCFLGYFDPTNMYF